MLDTNAKIRVDQTFDIISGRVAKLLWCLLEKSIVTTEKRKKKKRKKDFLWLTFSDVSPTSLMNMPLMGI
jgi:hypothetical protein